MKTFHCGRCQHHVFFENVKCESCAALLGFVPDLSEVCAFEPAGEMLWRALHPSANGALLRQCNNYALENVCNWMIPADSPDVLCPACSLTRTIPNLAQPENRVYWYRLETAKRRLLYALWALGLNTDSRRTNPESGLQFEFLEDGSVGPKVLTGHDNGLITMNIAEADDALRERARAEMGEPYRTLLGHFRHEIAHYYFDRLVAQSDWQELFREMFGDERVDYAQALQVHYENGPPANWEESYVSAYATTHPWEDWAETWAHYLHIVDTVDTAAACGFKLDPKVPNEPSLTEVEPIENTSFDNLMEQWFPLMYALNSLNRSLGLADAYPFTLSPKVVAKLRFVHNVIASANAPKQADGGVQQHEQDPQGSQAAAVG
ncbi:hypothetical protein EOS_16320 [Caballeronia mineralivorans PML1(12)]|uniref:Zinc-ribbon domain-containing protein n=1 Tax=Caballeronia mineralivorans PML1(12) TaxID=908627 RepID=A0A0J1CX62_9BURK|nr:putative zinc-binding metallopeptidase [Caballeronia mineralivorans]KLU25154.1 hypothetical protein EOS_16320 [Caballeronia mineralivorans PML1(12)]